MPDIFQDFPVKAPPDRVYQAISSPTGLDNWWTQRSNGKPIEGTQYELWFGPQYDWRAIVSKCTLNREFELRMTASDADWQGTLVGFRLEPKNEMTWVRFYHIGWPSVNEHYRISCLCWALYLRILRRYLEHGEVAAHENRLDS